MSTGERDPSRGKRSSGDGGGQDLRSEERREEHSSPGRAGTEAERELRRIRGPALDQGGHRPQGAWEPPGRALALTLSGMRGGGRLPPGVKPGCRVEKRSCRGGPVCAGPMCVQMHTWSVHTCLV